MKILHVITSLRTGGAEKLISEIVPMLRDLGHQIDVCLFDGIDTNFKNILLAAGIHIISFDKVCNVYNPLFIYKLWRLMRYYDIVHTHNTAPQFFAAIASCFSHCQLITTEHSTFNNRRNKAYLKGFDKWMYERYKYVICISDKTKDNLLNYLGCNNTHTVVICNGLDIEKYQCAKPLRVNEKSTFKKVITMIAGFRYQKDHETVIRAFARLDKNIYELWFVGDGERRKHIEACLKEYKVLNNVRLWGIREDISSIIKSSDIIVQSSHIEGFGLAAVEGMAAGKPVVASDVDGLSQVVEGAGVLFPQGDDKALAKIINNLFADNSYYESVAVKCNERALKYDIKTMVDAYHELYCRAKF